EPQSLPVVGQKNVPGQLFPHAPQLALRGIHAMRKLRLHSLMPVAHGYGRSAWRRKGSECAGLRDKVCELVDTVLCVSGDAQALHGCFRFKDADVRVNGTLLPPRPTSHRNCRAERVLERIRLPPAAGPDAPG